MHRGEFSYLKIIVDYWYMNKNIYSIIVLSFLLVGMNYLNAWTGPATTPSPTNPPNNNVAAPINIGGIEQVKAGDLGAANFIADNVTATNEVVSLTKMLSPEYCDETGLICTSGGSLGGAGLGSGQTWKSVTASRARNVWYQNTTSQPIFVSIRTNVGASMLYFNTSASDVGRIEIGGQDGASGTYDNLYGVIPAGGYYKEEGATPAVWAELSAP